MGGTISKYCSSLIPHGDRKRKFHQSIFSWVMVHFIFMYHYTHAHTCSAVSHILMALLWPEHAWSGLGHGRDPGLTETHQSYNGCENLRDLHTWKEPTHAQGRNSWGDWLLGHRCGDRERKWELFPFFLLSSPLKRNSSPSLLHSLPHLWKHPISIHIFFTQFAAHISFAPSASPPLSSSISYSQLGHTSNLRHYLCRPFI